MLLNAGVANVLEAEGVLGRLYSVEEIKAYSDDHGFPAEIQTKLRYEVAQKSLNEKDRALVLAPAKKAVLSVIDWARRRFALTGSQPTEREVLAFLNEDEKASIATGDALSDVDREVLNKQKKLSIDRLKLLNATFDKIHADLIKSDPASPINPLTSYLQAENLRSSLGCAEIGSSCAGAYILQVKVLSAGGNTRTKKNLITNLFTGADITHSGGSIVEYRLYDMSGSMVGSNTFSVYEYYRKPKSISKMSDEDFKTEAEIAFVERQRVMDEEKKKLQEERKKFEDEKKALEQKRKPGN